MTRVHEEPVHLCGIIGRRAFDIHMMNDERLMHIDACKNHVTTSIAICLMMCNVARAAENRRHIKTHAICVLLAAHTGSPPNGSFIH